MMMMALENRCLELRNSFEGLEPDGEARPQAKWRELKGAIAEAFQTHLGRTCNRRRVTGEMNALAEQARLAKIQCAPYHTGLRRQTTKELQRDRNVYWKAIAEETEESVACVDTR